MAADRLPHEPSPSKTPQTTPIESMSLQLEEDSLTSLSPIAWAQIEAAKLVLCDLDGCLAIDNVPLSGADRLASSLGDRLTVVSNNSTLRSTDLAARLLHHGLPINPAAIYLAGEIAIRIVATRHPSSRVLVIGSQQMRSLASELGLELVDDRPDVVVLARDDNLRMLRAQKIIDALSRGATFYLTNPDRSRPGSDGIPQIETGAVQIMLQAVLPGVEPIVIGKPSAALFEHVLAERAIQPEDALMIGDTFETDIRGAAAVGIRSIWLRARPLA